MKQVQIKIEDGFGGNCFLDTNNAFFPMEAWWVIEAKTEKTSFQVMRRYKPNESRESIIEALWELQKSMLPDGYYTKKIFIMGNINIYKGKDELVGCFYDPETRIITITDFEQEADR